MEDSLLLIDPRLLDRCELLREALPLLVVRLIGLIVHALEEREHHPPVEHIHPRLLAGRAHPLEGEVLSLGLLAEPLVPIELQLLTRGVVLGPHHRHQTVAVGTWGYYLECN